MEQSELITFLKVHESKFTSRNEKEKKYVPMIINILKQGNARKLSEKQREILNNFYAYNLNYLCTNFGEDCDICSDSKMNRVKFLSVIQGDAWKNSYNKITDIAQEISEFLCDLMLEYFSVHPEKCVPVGQNIGNEMFGFNFIILFACTCSIH